MPQNDYENEWIVGSMVPHSPAGQLNITGTDSANIEFSTADAATTGNITFYGAGGGGGSGPQVL